LLGKEVVFIGEQDGQTLTCNDIAEKTGTGKAETGLGISRPVPGIFYKDGSKFEGPPVKEGGNLNESSQ